MVRRVILPSKKFRIFNVKRTTIGRAATGVFNRSIACIKACIKGRYSLDTFFFFKKLNLCEFAKDTNHPKII